MNDSKSQGMLDYPDFEVLYQEDNLVVIGDLSNVPSYTKIPKNALVILGAESGQMQIDINGEEQRIGVGDIMIVAPNVKTANLMSSSDFRGVGIAMSIDLAQSLIRVDMKMIERMFLLTSHPVFHIDEPELFEHYGNLMYYYIKHKDKRYQREIIHKLVGAMLYELVSYEGGGMAEIEANYETRQYGNQVERIFKKFMNILMELDVKDRQVAQYASRLNITPKYLSHVCKKVSGRTALEWINEYIVRDIRYYLSSTDFSFKEISIKLGFPNLSFFGKYVKQHVGMSPSRYRAEVKSADSQKKE